MKSAFAFAGLLVASSAAIAATETYVSDPSHTFVRFEYSHFGYSTQMMRFNKSEAKVNIDRAAKTGSVEVSVDLKSIDTGSALDEHIQGEDFFDTAKNPTATFKSSKLLFEGDKLSAVEGDFTLKGVTKPVTLKVSSFMCMPHPMAKKDACGANASVTVKRTDFNMGKYAPYVSDDVTITVAIEALKQ